MWFAEILHERDAVQRKIINFHYSDQAEHDQLMSTASKKKSMKNVSLDKKLI